MKDLYVNIADFQGTDFAIGRTGTIEQWRQQALDWLDNNDFTRDYIEYLKNLDSDKVIAEISDNWQIYIVKCEMIGE